MYPWFKMLHVLFVMLWFAGLFVLPRLLWHLAQIVPNTTETQHEYQRVLLIARTLWRYLTPWAMLAVVFGLCANLSSGVWQGWAHSKVTLAVMLLAYHAYTWRLLQDLIDQHNRVSARWLQVYAQVPLVILVLALYLVVFKPF